MDQRTLQVTATDRYSGVALGVECAWPAISGAPTAVQGFSSSSTPKRDPEVGGAFPLRAASVALAAVLLAVTPPASAAPYAPEEYDFSELSSMGPASFGTVESVREVARRPTHAQLADVFEHSLNAETGDELVVRLDDGRAVTLRLIGEQRFQPGERVRLLGGRVLRT
jgi:outer membrane lipoprotein SlyB